jgi:hypothetical protein
MAWPSPPDQSYESYARLMGWRSVGNRLSANPRRSATPATACRRPTGPRRHFEDGAEAPGKARNAFWTVGLVR